MGAKLEREESPEIPDTVGVPDTKEQVLFGRGPIIAISRMGGNRVRYNNDTRGGGEDDTDRGTSEDQYHNMRMSPQELKELYKEQAERKLRERLEGKRIRTPSELRVRNLKKFTHGELLIDDGGTQWELMKIGNEWKFVEFGQVNPND